MPNSSYNNKSEVIDLRDVAKKILMHKKQFFKVWIITFAISCFIIFPVPRTYVAVTTVAPESSEASGGTLSSIASSFGFNVGNMTNADAFYPDIYPDVMASNEFIAKLMYVKVKTLDGNISTDYYTYLLKHQKTTFYMIPIGWGKKMINSLIEKKETKSNNNGTINTFMLSDRQTQLFESVRNSIICSVDKKTGVVSITVTDQDPLVCATMADSARVHLLNFITTYRTNKARVDCEYYSRLVDEARTEYEVSMAKYGAFCDSHINTILQSEISKRDALENEMSLKLNAYNQMNNQLSLSKAKLQESTPAFSLLQSSTVPVKPAGPKRMLFIIGMLFFSTLIVVVRVFKKEILDNIYKKEQGNM